MSDRKWAGAVAAGCLALSFPCWSLADPGEHRAIDAYQRGLSRAVDLERAGQSAQAALTAAQAAEALAADEELRVGARVAWRAAAAARTLAAAELRRGDDRHPRAGVAAAGDPSLAELRRSALRAFQEVAQELARDRGAGTVAAGVRYADAVQPAGAVRDARVITSVRF